MVLAYKHHMKCPNYQTMRLNQPSQLKHGAGVVCSLHALADYLRRDYLLCSGPSQLYIPSSQLSRQNVSIYGKTFLSMSNESLNM